MPRLPMPRASLRRLSPSSRALHALVAGALAVSLSVGGPPSARAAGAALDTHACVSAYDDAQRLRNLRKLSSARARLVVCAHASCPAAARSDCATWLTEVERSIPTLVLSARTAAGEDVRDARITIDGAAVAPGTLGFAIAVDPGPHAVRGERDGFAPAIEDVVVREGEKNRSITLVLVPSTVTETSSKGQRSPPPTPAAPLMVNVPDRQGAQAHSVLPYVFGGTALAGFGAFTALALTTEARERELRTTCAPSCPSDDVAAVRTRYMVADVALGVGVVAAAATIVALVTARRHAGGAQAAAAPIDPRGPFKFTF